MIYSRGGLTDELYRGTKVAFAWHKNDIKSIPLALLVSVRTNIAEGMNPGMEKISVKGNGNYTGAPRMISDHWRPDCFFKTCAGRRD